MKLSAIVTLVLFFISVPVAYGLAFTKSRFKPIIESITTLPIVLPPTVIGFYLLVFLSQNSPVGLFFLNTFDISLVFSFTGVIIASCVYSFPFMVQPLQTGFENINKSIIEASYVAKKSKFSTLVNVLLPNIKPNIISAMVITFAHTMGEFGVVLMVGGSIPGETKVAAIAIYEEVEDLNYAAAHVYSGILVLLSFFVLLTVYIVNQKKRSSVHV